MSRGTVQSSSSATPAASGERAQEREVHVGAAPDLLVAVHRRDVAVMRGLRLAHRADDRVDLVERHRLQRTAGLVRRVEAEPHEPVEVVLGRRVRGAEVGDPERDVVEHERGGEVASTARRQRRRSTSSRSGSAGRSRGRASPGRRGRARDRARCPALPDRVSNHMQEQVADERRVEPLDGRPLRRRRSPIVPSRSSSATAPRVGTGVVRVPRLHRPVTAERARRPLPEVEDGIDRRRDRRPESPIDATTLRPRRKKLGTPHRCTVLMRVPGRRPVRPISSAGIAASMARTISG